MTRTSISSLMVLAPVGALVLLASGSAQAATPTYYNNLATFQADITSTVTDDYSNPAYVFNQNNAVMSAVLGQTDYMSTGFNNLNLVSGGYYCAGCNGSFQLSFQTTSVGNAAGVNGVGVYIQTHSLATPYYAYITYADGTTANIALPAAGTFWGVAAPERIQQIHFGLSMGATTQGGSFGIDNLIVGDGNVGGCTIDTDCFDDGDPCTDPVCIGGMCDFDFNTAPCDDGNICTELDVCAAGVCEGSILDCDDGNACTTNFCDPMAGCVLQLNTDPCDDGDLCTEADVCAAGVCGGAMVDCNDDNACSMDSCVADIGCVNEPEADCCLGDEDCGADQFCSDENMCIPYPSDTSGTSAGDSGDTGTPGSTGADGSGGGSGAGDSGTNETDGAGSTGGGTGGVITGGELPPADLPTGCGCTTTPPARDRLWWLMAGLGLFIRRRRNAARA